MTKIAKQDRHFFLEAKKRIGVPRHYGRAILGFSHFGDDDIKIELASGKTQIVSGIYQVRTRYGRRVQTIEAYRTGGNSHTEAQQSNRLKFAAAVAAWQDLTTEDKQVYNIRSQRLHLFGYSLFLREYMKSH